MADEPMKRSEVEELIEGMPEEFREQIEEVIMRYLHVGLNFHDAAEAACSVMLPAYESVGCFTQPDWKAMMRIAIKAVAWLMCDNYQRRSSYGSN